MVKLNVGLKKKTMAEEYVADHDLTLRMFSDTASSSGRRAAYILKRITPTLRQC